MREKNRKPIGKRKKLPQLTTMNVIGGQAVIESYFSLVFCNLTPDNILNIVVLLILAGVTINFVLGKGGIIDMAKEAADRTNKAIEQEQADIDNLEGEIQNLIDGGTTGSSSGGDPSIPPKEKNDIAKEYGKKQEDNKTVSDGTEDSDSKITIPKGYTVLDPEKNENVSYVDNDNPQIEEGVVVQDPDGNEFVWVPVAINDMVWCKDHVSSEITYENGELFCAGAGEKHTPNTTQLVGKLYNFSGNTLTPITTYDANSGYREPAIVTNSSSGEGASYDGANGNLSKVVEGEEKTRAKFLEQLQNEFYNMAKSVAKYGGFYIGRYETSSLNTETPKVQKGKDPTVSTDWYTMYKNSKEIAKGTGATSRMIWGCQWDAVMKWMKDVENTTQDGKYYITDSTGMGHYEQSNKTTTGSDPKYAVKNIYDMAGNVWKWTMEAIDANGRVLRGGGYYDSGSSSPASDRQGSDPTVGYDSSLSSRATLYVN